MDRLETNIAADEGLDSGESGGDPRFAFAFLLYETAWLIRREFQARADEIGLTQVQARVLAHVARTEGISQVLLAQRLEISPMTLGKHLERMEAGGLIERRRDEHDRRAWNVFVTPLARPMLDRIRIVAQDIRANALCDLSGDEETALIALLQRLKANMLNSGPAGDRAERRERRVS